MHFRCEQKCSSRMWWRTSKAGDSHLQVQDKLQNRKRGGPWKMGRFWEGWRVCLHPLEEVTSIAQLQFQPTAGAFSQVWGAPLSVVTWGRIPVSTWLVSSRLWLGAAFRDLLTQTRSPHTQQGHSAFFSSWGPHLCSFSEGSFRDGICPAVRRFWFKKTNARCQVLFCVSETKALILISRCMLIGMMRVCVLSHSVVSYSLWPHGQ